METPSWVEYIPHPNMPICGHENRKIPRTVDCKSSDGYGDEQEQPLQRHAMALAFVLVLPKATKICEPPFTRLDWSTKDLMPVKFDHGMPRHTTTQPH